MFTNRCDAGARTTLPAEDVEHLDGLAPTDAVRREPAVLLEVNERSNCGRSEDAIRASAIEADVVKHPLEFLNVVPAQLGCFEEQCAVTESVTSFDDRQPRLFVTDPVDVEPAGLLEARDGIDCARAKHTRLGTCQGIPGGTEAAL